jgi:hypothetical protein
MRSLAFLTFFVAFLAPLASAVKLLESNALNVCMESSNFTATYFNVVFYPGNNSLTIGFDGYSYISGKVVADLSLTAYGYKAYSSTIDPCSIEGMGMCPMASGPIDLGPVSLSLPAGTSSNVPGKSHDLIELRKDCVLMESKALPIPFLISMPLCGLRSKRRTRVRGLPVSRLRFPTTRVSTN